MKKDTPISLFSFQDIITCLTGIMIVIVLIILLQLVEAMVKHTADSPLAEEVQNLRKREKELIALRDSLNIAEDEVAEEIRQYSAFSSRELAAMLETYRKNLKILTDEKDRLNMEMIRLRSNEENLDKAVKLTEEDLKKVKNLEAEVKKKYQELAAKKNQREDLKQEIARKEKSVSIQFPGISKRTPLLIECNVWGFRIKKYPDGKIITLGSRNSSVSGQLNALRGELQKYDKNNVYIVLLFKPGMLRYYNQITAAVGNIKCGKELILENEDFFL